MYSQDDFGNTIILDVAHDNFNACLRFILSDAE
jgi:hypothetical protein